MQIRNQYGELSELPFRIGNYKGSWNQLGSFQANVSFSKQIGSLKYSQVHLIFKDYNNLKQFKPSDGLAYDQDFINTTYF